MDTEHAFEYNDDVGLVVHKPEVCIGPNCVIHNPSDHVMREFPLHWRGDRGIFERLCSHGVGHPDPDDVWFHKNILNDPAADVHGCDGCCLTG